MSIITPSSPIVAADADAARTLLAVLLGALVGVAATRRPLGRLPWERPTLKFFGHYS